MPADAYKGHDENSVAKAVADNPDNVAPADRNDYNPDDYADQPGAAARTNKYPRSDGKAG